VLAAVIQQPLTDVFIYGVRTIEPDRVGLLNLDHPKATQALDAQ
jgi:hypothetical protein